MFTVTKPEANRLDIVLSGAPNASEMDAGLTALIKAAKDISGGKMLYRVDDLAMPSLSALAIELQHLPSLLGLLRKFDKGAILSDQSWLRKAAEIKGGLIPGLEIRALPLENVDEAEAWLDA